MKQFLASLLGSTPALSLTNLPNAKTYKFPEPDAPHLATVKDRTRSSGLTSVRFVDAQHVVVGDFANKRCYYARIHDGEFEILDQHPTMIADGTPVETDLIDYHDGKFIVSNFYQGSISLFTIRDGRIHFEREIETGNVRNMHGLRFIPGKENLIWATYCNAKSPCSKIIDLETGKILHVLPTDQQCQDVAFVDDYIIVFARTDHISKGTKKARFMSRKSRMFATAYVYRMPDDIENQAPEFVSRWKGKGHIDAVMETPSGEIYAANQYLDRVDVFRISKQGELEFATAISGFTLPHGLDVKEGRVAVTNYGDQTLRLFDLPKVA